MPSILRAPGAKGEILRPGTYRRGMDQPLVSRMRPYGETIFARMTALATAHDAVNLGQGFPDTDGPAEVLEAAREAISDGHNQYPPGPGIPSLREAVASHQQERYGLGVDPDGEVLVTTGATEAIASALLALVEPGDEVVVIEPYYDSYAAGISLAGGIRRAVPLRRDLTLDREALTAAFSERTRAVLVNTPHNPTGRVLTREELGLVADLARRHHAWVISDEVYEHMTFDGAGHVPIATLPGMWERTVTIGSAGKSFSVTGWKVGWVSGPRELVTAVRTVKQFLTYTSGAPFQPAVARALSMGPAPLEELTASLQSRRDLLVEGLLGAGLDVSVPEGTYFVVADAAPLGVTDATSWCLELPERVGVVAVPVSVFCDDPSRTASLVRFAFCKREPVLEEACRRLARL